MQPAAYQEVPTDSASYPSDHTDRASDDGMESQHFCFKCGKARSKRYHMENPIKPGSKVPASCCTKCRSKITSSEPGSKYLQHFCADCGKVRSRGYHKDHPVQAGKKPRPSYCLNCRTRREEEAGDEADWEDLDPDVSTTNYRPSVVGNLLISYKELVPPPRRPSSHRHYVAMKGGRAVPSGSERDGESEGFIKPGHARGASKEFTRLSTSTESRRRRVSKASLNSTHPFQASLEEALPTPPQTPQPLDHKHKPVEKKRAPEENATLEANGKEQLVGLEAQVAAPGTGPASETALCASHERDDCKSHVHVVYIHPPCYHHGHDDEDTSCRHAAKGPGLRGRRADSSTTTTSSKQSRRVAFATPEVSSRHEADADYDRTAVPENHEYPFEFGTSAGSSRDNYYARGFDPDGPPRRSPTPGPTARGFDSSSVRSSSEYISTPDTGPSQPRMDGRSPPPEYTAPPPKIFTPDEIRRLWEQGPQPVHPRRQREAAALRNNGPAASGDNFARNQRSVSEGDYPRGNSEGFNRFRPSNGSEGTSRLDNPSPSDYGRSGGWHDHRYKNDENVDPKTRYTSTRDARPSESRSHQGSSQRGANMHNGTDNARPGRSTGPTRPSEDVPNMYNNNQTDQYGNSRPSMSRSGASTSENNSRMYDNQTNASAGPHPNQSRASNSKAANKPGMYNNGTGDSPQSDGPWYKKYEPSSNNSREPSTSAPAQEAPFTARERMWTDNPEHARKLRAAMERLERAAAANPTKTAPSPRAADIRANNSPIPEFSAAGIPGVSTPDSNKRNFASSTRNFASPDFGSTRSDYGSAKPEFGSENRDFTSSTRRDFSPNVSPDFVPPRPFGFSSSPRRRPTRTTSASTWEHPCGPFCNEFCPDREDRVSREIVEVDSDEEKEILSGVDGVEAGGGSGREGRKDTLRRPSSDRAVRLALVRLRRCSVADDRVGPLSPAKSVGSTYYTASETSCR